MQGQNTPKGSFVIKDNADLNNTEFYELAIIKSNLEQYRLKVNDVELVFENGFKLVLFSYEKAVQREVNLPLEAYPIEFPKNYSLPSFKLISSGQIIAKSASWTKESMITK